ncbi:MAG TPA: MGMT family protein [Acidimicrobiales bacterium]|nr:MGMT family protein [Acidimicrobiales bacterium]|tara:strand:- start:804 stop:1067 length:264 start_codon:yes stop_codon:yes gene_type:complete
MTPFEESVAKVLNSLRQGEVVTYGEVAAEAGFPAAHRAVGRFLKSHQGYPWWRVVTSTGRLVPGYEVEQASQLRSEGIKVVNGRVVA